MSPAEPARPIRWGVVGPGRIAAKFADGLQRTPDAVRAAVASRDPARAQDFAAAHGFASVCASYDELIARDDLDIVYLATTNDTHHALAKRCLEAGKAVLCEKPLALDLADVSDLVRIARERRVFLMEGLWTRFQPAHVRARELVADGAIGEPLALQADFGFAAPFDPRSRLFDPALGGGALLDLGVYPVSLSLQWFGPPQQIRSVVTRAATGVDDAATIVLGHAGGQESALSCSIRAFSPHEAVLCGTKGFLRYHAPWWRCRALSLVRNGVEERIECPFDGHGFQFEIAGVQQCLRDGRTESPVMTLDDTLALHRVLEEVRGGGFFQ